MADTKFTGLTALTTPQPTDILPIIDLSGTPTPKKVAVSDLRSAPASYAPTALTVPANYSVMFPGKLKIVADSSVTISADGIVSIG